MTRSNGRAIRRGQAFEFAALLDGFCQYVGVSASGWRAEVRLEWPAGEVWRRECGYELSDTAQYLPRMDWVRMGGGAGWVIEAKRVIDYAAIGQAMVYRRLLSAREDTAEGVWSGVVGDAIAPLVELAAVECGVWYWTPESTNVDVVDFRTRWDSA